MKIELMHPGERNKPCYFCGKVPSKYEVKLFDERGRLITTCVCNMCALIHNERVFDI